jgi:predicted nucleic acid-binding protein
LTFRATFLRRVTRAIELPRDPNDEPYINLAAAAKADFLVTRDNDLLSLMTGHSAVAKQFRQKTRPLKVINPVAFLEAIRNSE